MRRWGAAVAFVILMPFVAVAVWAAILMLAGAWLGWAAADLIAGFVAGCANELWGWQLHHHAGAWDYQINQTTGQRRAVHTGDGHSIVDCHWLRDGDVIVDEIGTRRLVFK